MRLRPFFAILVLLCGLLAPKWTMARGDAGLEFRGWLRTDLGVLQDIDGPEIDEPTFLGMHLLSLDARNTNRKVAKVETSLDIMLPYGLYRDLLSPEEAVSWELRKLYASLYFDWADVSVGRQIINFGKGLVLSPMDVFTTIDLTDLQFRRRGSDVARVRLSLPRQSGAEFVIQIPKSASDSTAGEAAAAKFYTNIKGWDISAVEIRRFGESESFTAGLAFKGDAIIGLYGELVGRWDLESEDGSFQAMIGADYSVNNRWFFGVEWLYEEEAEESASASLISFRPDIYGSIRYSINDLAGVTLGGFGSIKDEAFLPTLELSYSLLQNVDGVFYARLPLDLDAETVANLLWTGVRMTAKF